MKRATIHQATQDLPGSYAIVRNEGVRSWSLLTHIKGDIEHLGNLGTNRDTQSRRLQQQRVSDVLVRDIDALWTSCASCTGVSARHSK